MKAIVYEKYGSPDVLHLTEVEKPIPGEGRAKGKIVIVVEQNSKI
jgi:NADPH:quinone reductase-like Zn-dependent oxidoreductase